MRVCLDAADALSRDGVSAEVVDLRTLNPLDRDTIMVLRDILEKEGFSVDAFFR